ncbi:MAG: hypothetical protein QME25_02255 [Bacteroidota bacterium]|nr:hypothetical protein [Bacteroidota bacterium]
MNNVKNRKMPSITISKKELKDTVKESVREVIAQELRVEIRSLHK